MFTSYVNTKGYLCNIHEYPHWKISGLHVGHQPLPTLYDSNHKNNVMFSNLSWPESLPINIAKDQVGKYQYILYP